MPEYAYTLRVLLPDEERAIDHLGNLVRYHGFPAVGELWTIESDDTRRLILRTDMRPLNRARKEERAIAALRGMEGSAVWGPDPEGAYRRVVRAVLDA